MFLWHAFVELREFGELGVKMQRTHDNLRVDINIFTPDGEYDDEILAFVAQPAKQERVGSTDLLQ